MTELWYWRTNERVRGPLVTEELEAVVLNHRLADSDFVRLDGSDEWISAAEIRRMFLKSSGDSPAETAAKLLETAAARRLKGTADTQKSTALGGLLGRLADAVGNLAGSIAEPVTRGFQACTSWLGRRGRLIVTAVAGVAVLIFLLSLIPWGRRDTTRLLEIEELWERIQAKASRNSPAPAEVSQRLETLEMELDASLRDQPVSGTSGSGRRSSLARRELLFAVREMRESQTSLDDPTRERIDQSLRAASDFLSGAAVASEDPAAAEPQGRWSNEIVAILIFDALLGLVVATWWVMGRGRS
jgi:hypothetical protein